jgi:hypothetical protein
MALTPLLLPNVHRGSEKPFMMELTSVPSPTMLLQLFLPLRQLPRLQLCLLM